MAPLSDDIVQRHCRRKVFYYYDKSVATYHYGIGHPMKPQRIRLTHEIIQEYGMLRRLHVYRPMPLPFEELGSFHDPVYLQYLKGVSGDIKVGWKHRFSERFNIGEDCPPFDGCYDFSTLCAGGSVAAAKRLINGDCDVAINWSGGLHHAKKSEASGFCFINDAVLAIQELLTAFNRVLYIDIDIHHGDGVEEAFFTTNRVFTLSLHKYGDFFPGTGSLFDMGADKGKYFTMNVPLEEGINDEDYTELFGIITQKLHDYYRPDVIVMQCGADSLAGDRIGVFNLTTHGHGACVDMILKFNLPTLMLGGGGYTVRNVSRCWTYETAVALDEKSTISDDLPYNSYFEDFGPDFKLHTKPLNWRNKNSKESIGRMKTKLFEHLRKMNSYKPPQYENGVKILSPRRLAMMKAAAAAAASAAEAAARINQALFPGVDTVEAEALMRDAADPDKRVSDVERNSFREPLEDVADRAETGYSELDAAVTTGRATSGRRESLGTYTAPAAAMAVDDATVGGEADEGVAQDEISDADMLLGAPVVDDAMMMLDDEKDEDDDDGEEIDDENETPTTRKRMSLMTDYRRLQERLSDADEDENSINPPAGTSAAAAVTSEMPDNAVRRNSARDISSFNATEPTSSQDSATFEMQPSRRYSTSFSPRGANPENAVAGASTQSGLADDRRSSEDDSSAMMTLDNVITPPDATVSKTSSAQSTPSSSVQMSSRRSRRIANRSSRPSSSDHS